MKKKLKMTNLACAHCASKIEDAVRKLDGVNEVSVSFVMQKITLNVDDSAYPRVIEEAQVLANKIEPGCKILV